MSTTRQLHFTFDAASMRLTRLDRECMRVLEKLAKGHDECWAATEAIANRLGLEVRAAQLRVERLVKLGLVERVWDFTLNTRRRLVLLWRKSTTCVDGVSAEVCADWAQTSTLSTPPAPPISVLNGKRALEVEQIGGNPEPPPDPTCVPTPEETRTGPDPIEARAKQVTSDPTFAGWCRTVAGRWGLGFVLPALDRAAAKASREPIGNPRGLVTKIVGDFRVEGGPPADPAGPPAPAVRLTPSQRRRQEFLAGCRRRAEAARSASEN